MSRAFDLGFLVFLNYDQDGGALAALEDGIGLFTHAESLGYDSGGVRVHHGVRTLTSPFPFLTAAALATSRIRLATGIIPIGEELPLRFAEDAATADLFSGGRLDLGLSSGIPGKGIDPAARERLVTERLEEILAAVRGDALGDSSYVGRDDVVAEAVSAPDGEVTPLPHGPYGTAPKELFAFPRSPGLEHRLGYGAGGLSSALRAARLGLNLVLSTIGGPGTGPTLGHSQAELIQRYRDEFTVHHPDRAPKVTIGRSILPIVDERDQAEFGGLKDFYDRLVTEDGRYLDDSGFTGQASPLYAGSPAEIIDRLAADPALDLIDELHLVPITELTIAQKRHVFATVAEHVAPGIGWRQSAVAHVTA